MHTNQELIASLIKDNVLYTPALIKAFSTIDRSDFVPEEYQYAAYEDRPLPIGDGQTISQPFTVAFMLEHLSVLPDDNVLDIGTGSGWTTALLSCISRSVTGLERIPELVAFGNSNLKKYDFISASIKQAGEQLGVPGQRFDKILVSAAADHIPLSLIDQLNENGRMVIPVNHSIMVIDKDHKGEISTRIYEGFVFVPLIVSNP